MKSNDIEQITIRINDVVKMTSLSKSTIWRWVKEDKFPKPSKYTSTITVWRYDEILSWIDSKIPRSDNV
ncbi:helix-turn-helix transcriptional regulator [Psychrobacter sp. ASPA161_9]|uniref:helix-turn-helix transcriptional regulator n=1 Tax=Psychrobacter sp. ASPA161_9 TaxID=3160961 RepID=UPI003F802E79